MAVSVLAFVPSVRAQVGRIIAGVVPTPLVSLPGACPHITGGWVGSGVFIWPTALHVISGYDYNIQLHPAIDLAAALDAPVVAIDAGVVIFAGYNDYDYGYGNMVIIDHRNGWQSLRPPGCRQGCMWGECEAGSVDRISRRNREFPHRSSAF